MNTTTKINQTPTQGRKMNTPKKLNSKSTQGAKMSTTNKANRHFTAEDMNLFSWAGSKRKYKNSFETAHTELKVQKVKYYIEVFAGSLASLFHNIEHVDAETIVINDINKKLINLYKHIQKSPKELFKKFKILEDEYMRIIPEHLLNKKLVPTEDREEFQANNDFYLEIRAVLNSIDLDINHAALLLFLLNRNFKGLYNENKKGKINSSFNWSAKPLNMTKIETAINNLHLFFNANQIVFETMDAAELIEKYKCEDTFIYLDPPYIDTEIQYTQQNKKSFKLLQTHLDMLESCNKYRYVLYSNNHHEDFIPLFDSYTNFFRSNGIAANSTKSKQEILAYKVNKAKAIEFIPVMQLLDISLRKDITPVNNPIQSKAVSKLLDLDMPENRAA